MRCPICVAAAKEHELHVDAPPANKQTFEEFWDVLDRQHIHDRQLRACHARCSNGHSFTVRFLSRCPCLTCEWNQQPEIAGVGWPDVGKPNG